MKILFKITFIFGIVLMATGLAFIVASKLNAQTVTVIPPQGAPQVYGVQRGVNPGDVTIYNYQAPPGAMGMTVIRRSPGGQTTIIGDPPPALNWQPGQVQPGVVFGTGQGSEGEEDGEGE
ncbi:MAG: hypothetical protein ACLP7A_00825 [Desulfobaccales bacterium]